MKKLKYTFDKIMSKGVGVMLALLAIIMLVVVGIIAAIIIAGGFSEDEGVFYTFWEVFATTINAWMPSAEDGDAIYVLLISLSAIVGLFFTSFLIGIISSAIEDKLSRLRKGNSDVVEKNHIVILGFEEGKYTLLEQLILATEKAKTCIVIAEEMDVEELLDSIRDNIDIPKNIHIVCRNIDSTDPASLNKCALNSARLILVNPIEDKRTVKTLLAVSQVLGENENDVKIVTTIIDEKYLIPETIRRQHGFIILRTDLILSRIIAHSCTQPGLAGSFFQVFNFEGNEFYINHYDGLEGHRWADAVLNMNAGVPVGVIRDGDTYLNPDSNYELHENDEIIVFEENKGQAKLSFDHLCKLSPDRETEIVLEGKLIMLIGSIDRIAQIIEELPGTINELLVVTENELDHDFMSFCGERGIGIRQSYHYDLLLDEAELVAAAGQASHIVILGNASEDTDVFDMDNIMSILRLKAVREDYGFDYTITAVLQREDNRKLVVNDGIIDFIVSSDMSAMMLTQVAITPGLYDTFIEILSNEGNEFFLKPASNFDLVGSEHSIFAIRESLLSKHCILLGYISGGEKREIILNPSLEDTIMLKDEDMLIVIAEKPVLQIETPAMG